jgi:hypothetical protein
MLWVFEILAIVGLVLALTLPIQDYVQFQHPSPETSKAFLERQEQARGVRLIIAVPFLATIILLSDQLRKNRRK